MDIQDLMKELATLWPNAFAKQEALEAWSRQYRIVLEHAQGPRLQEAFDACMADWTKNSPPKPADLKGYLPTPTSAEQPVNNHGPVNYKKLFQHVDDNEQRLIDEAVADLQHRYPHESYWTRSRTLRSKLRETARTCAQIDYLEQHGHISDGPSQRDKYGAHIPLTHETAEDLRHRMVERYQVIKQAYQAGELIRGDPAKAAANASRTDDAAYAEAA